MTVEQLRHHAWNYNVLAQSAERNAVYADTDREVDLWNNAVLMFQDLADRFEREIEIRERQTSMFAKFLPSRPAGSEAQ
jgi:hypothetical protein